MSASSYWILLLAVIFTNCLATDLSKESYSDPEILSVVRVLDILPEFAFSHLAFLVPEDKSDILQSQINNYWLWIYQSSSLTFQTISLR